MVLDGKSLQEYPVNAGISQGFIHRLPGKVISYIAISADGTTLYSKCDKYDKHLICVNI